MTAINDGKLKELELLKSRNGKKLGYEANMKQGTHVEYSEIKKMNDYN